MVCPGGQQNMGSIPHVVEDGGGDKTLMSPEEILKLTKTPKKPLVFIPRSRSPSDLPGGIRVPVLKKPESRLKSRLQANVTSLEELRSLKQKHQAMVNDVTSSSASPEHGPLDYLFKKSSCRSTSTSSFGSLSSISEEGKPGPSIASPRRSSERSNEVFIGSCEKQHGRLDRSLSPSEKRRSYSSTCSSVESQGEMTLDDVRTQNEFDVVNEKSKPEHTEITRSSASYPSDPNIYFPDDQNFPKRRASVHVVQNRRTSDTPTGLSLNSNVKQTTRRASIQCEAIMTKHRNGEATSKILSDLKLQYNEGPVRAIMRQYGSSANLKCEVASPASTINSSTGARDPKDVLRGWFEESKKRHFSSGDSEKRLDNSMVQMLLSNEQDTVKAEAVKNTIVSTNVITPKHGYFSGNIREQSFTSDYYGSIETINSVQSLPARVLLTPGGQTFSGVTEASSLQTPAKYFNTRRHSLPINSLSSRPRHGRHSGKFNNATRKFGENSACQRLFKTIGSENSNLCPDVSKRGFSFIENGSVCSEDDVFEEESDENISNKSVAKGLSKSTQGDVATKVLDHISDEGYEESINGDIIENNHTKQQNTDYGSKRYSESNISHPGFCASKPSGNRILCHKKPLLETSL